MELFYSTGTGNSLWAARLLARELGGARLLSLKHQGKDPPPRDADAVGIVFPVRMYGVPRPVVEFARGLQAEPSRFIFAVTTNGGEPAGSGQQLERIFAARGLVLSAFHSLTLPSSYIPWGGPGSKEEQQRMFSVAEAEIRRIAEAVRERRLAPPRRHGPLAGRAFRAAVYRLTYPLVPRMDRLFRTDRDCPPCKICEEICPARNIEVRECKPVWLHRCEQCFACLQWCPEKNIQWGRNTAKYERYHHPEVTLQDMLHQAKANKG